MFRRPPLTSISASSGMIRSWIAAEAVTTLNVDPGSYRSWTARLRRANSVASRYSFGSNVGSLASARISPVCGIHDDGRAADGAVVKDTGMQLPLGDVLQELVDGQFDGRSGGWRTLESVEGMAPRVGLHEHLAVFAADLRVVRGLEAIQALAVDADESEHVRGELLVRILAMAFLDEADPVEIHRRDLRGHVLRDLPADVSEVPLLRQPIDESPAAPSRCSRGTPRRARRPTSASSPIAEGTA